VELRDGGEPFGGKGVMQAVENVRGRSLAVARIDAADQAARPHDDRARRDAQQARLGANAISLVAGRAKAMAMESCSRCGRTWAVRDAGVLPVPMMNV